MKLYLITGRIKNKKALDYYNSAVVAARTPEHARKIHPNGAVFGEAEHWDKSTWCEITQVDVELVGSAIKGTKPGVICASFNAG